MRKLQLIIIAVVALMVVACQPKQEADYMLLTGMVEDYNGEPILVIGADRSQRPLSIDENGIINDTIKGETGFYMIAKQRDAFRFFAFHGETLEVNFNATDLTNSVSFAGNVAVMSQYLLEKSKIENEERAGMRDLFKLPEQEFIQKIEASDKTKKELLAKFTAIPDSIKVLEEKAINVDAISNYMNFPRYHAYFAGNQDYEASETLKAKTENFDKNDEALYVYSDAYKQLLRVSGYEKADALIKEGKTESMLMALLMVQSEIESQIMRDDMMYSSMKQSLGREDKVKDAYDYYMQFAKDEAKIEEMTELYAELAELIAGKPSPKFVDYENYKGGTSSLDDFKGKYVYIDVWATWCGPCKAEIPHLQKVEEKYHGKNIEFVSISVDDARNKDAWKTMVKEKEMGGVQLWAVDKDFMDSYKISGIPRFILIDPEGNIVQKSAPRPSDSKLIDLFNELGI